MQVFPTLGNLQEVKDYAESKLPITNKNDMAAILYTYHNTLLKEISDEEVISSETDSQALCPRSTNET